MSATAYSYIRFSTPEQRQGDSLRRQTEAAADWCKRHQIQLDTSVTLHDLGTSAFTGEHRKNPDRNALAAFVKLIERGRVPRGSYLIIENLDRLTREDERAALRLWMDILDAGVNIVQLNPETVFRHEKSDMVDIIRAIIELSRGHSESAMKAVRNGKAWRAKLAAARKGEKQPPRKRDGRITAAITGRLPAWIEERNGKPAIIPERAEVVRRIFLMAGGGYGISAIVNRMTEDGVPPFGDRKEVVDDKGRPVEVTVRGKKRSKYRAGTSGQYGRGEWVRAYVAKILKDRRALGEYQPCGKGRKPVGEVIQGYFPAVVTAAEFDAAEIGLKERRVRPGRTAKHVNLFSGLVRDARNPADTFFTGTLKGHRYLINTAGAEGRAPYTSFPAETFERAVLSLLREIDPHEILNGDNAPDESIILAGQLVAVETELQAAVAFMDSAGFSVKIGERVKNLEGQQVDLSGRLADARQRAAHPASESWGEMRTIIETLDGAADREETRLRLRSTLRRTIVQMLLFVVPRGRDRIACVQIWFADASESRNTARTVVIYHSSPRCNAKSQKDGAWWATSLSLPAEGWEGFDLRKSGTTKSNAKAIDTLEKVLAEIGPTWFDGRGHVHQVIPAAKGGNHA